MKEFGNSVLGVAWYRREDYPFLRALASDANDMADTYEQWLAGVMKLTRELQERGYSARRVDVDIRELAAWCEAQGRPLDGAARSEFVTLKVQQGG